jgi:hypothetical protein
MHRHVKIVGILMIVQGALEAAMGIMYAFMGPLMLAMMSMSPSSGSSGAPPPDEKVMGLMGGFYLLIGLGVLAAGVLKIVAGILNLKFRGRVLGFVALGSSIVSMFTCYCAPTGIALGVYGLVVYLNAQAARAFALAAQGMGPDEVLANLEGPPPGYGGGYGYPPPPGYGGYPPGPPRY